MMIIMKVMYGVQMVGEYLTSLKKMPQVGTRIVTTGIAGTLFIKGTFILSMHCIFYNYLTS